MPMLVCEYCGREFTGKTTRRYCSRTCYDALCQQVREARETQKWEDIQAEAHEDDCRFNNGVCCFPVGDCSHCGWNPAVAEKRLVRILSRMMGVEEVVSSGN